MARPGEVSFNHSTEPRDGVRPYAESNAHKEFEGDCAAAYQVERSRVCQVPELWPICSSKVPTLALLIPDDQRAVPVLPHLWKQLLREHRGWLLPAGLWTSQHPGEVGVLFGETWELCQNAGHHCLLWRTKSIYLSILAIKSKTRQTRQLQRNWTFGIRAARHNVSRNEEGEGSASSPNGTAARLQSQRCARSRPRWTASAADTDAEHHHEVPKERPHRHQRRAWQLPDADELEYSGVKAALWRSYGSHSPVEEHKKWLQCFDSATQRGISKPLCQASRHTRQILSPSYQFASYWLPGWAPWITS